MSIAARVVPLSRSFRSLIKTRVALAKPIKDLKDLRVLRRRAGYRHSGPTDLKRTRDVFFVARTMARDRPSFYDEGDFCRRGPGRRAALLHRDQEVSPTVLHRLHRDRDSADRKKSRLGGLSYQDGVSPLHQMPCATTKEHGRRAFLAPRESQNTESSPHQVARFPRAAPAFADNQTQHSHLPPRLPIEDRQRVAACRLDTIFRLARV